jgi:SAM-dependent methyltransferase
VIEIPWVLSRLQTGQVLEVGYAFAEPAYLAALCRLVPSGLVGVDLAEAAVAGMETVVADVRAMPFDDRSSTGCSSSRRSSTSARTTSVRPRARRRRCAHRRVAEVRQVLRPGGSLLVTVPLGEPENYGWFRQEDVGGWCKLFIRAGLFIEEQEAYELLGEGWRAAPAFDPQGVRYGERGPAASAVLCADLSPRRLRRLVTPDGAKRTLRRRLGPALRRLRGSEHGLLATPEQRRAIEPRAWSPSGDRAARPGGTATAASPPSSSRAGRSG